MHCEEARNGASPGRRDCASRWPFELFGEGVFFMGMSHRSSAHSRTWIITIHFQHQEVVPILGKHSRRCARVLQILFTAASLRDRMRRRATDVPTLSLRRVWFRYARKGDQ